MENPIANLALNYWYKVLIAGGLFVFLVNGTGVLSAYPTTATALISLGCTLWGIGEWVNHPLQTWLHFDYLGRIVGTFSGYLRRPYFFGILMDILGIAMITIGVIKLF